VGKPDTLFHLLRGIARFWIKYCPPLTLLFAYWWEPQPRIEGASELGPEK
jgi:hypothetical protein